MKKELEIAIWIQKYCKENDLKVTDTTVYDLIEGLLKEND